MKTTRIAKGEYKVEFNGTITVIRQRYATDTGVKKGWLLFNTGETCQTSDLNNWGCEAYTKREALQWIKEEYTK
jgi:hypothetical protein